MAVDGLPAESVPRYKQYPFSPDPPTLSDPAVKEKYGPVALFQPLLDILLPPDETAIVIDEAFVVGAVVSNELNPIEISENVGVVV